MDRSFKCIGCKPSVEADGSHTGASATCALVLIVVDCRNINSKDKFIKIHYWLLVTVEWIQLDGYLITAPKKGCTILIDMNEATIIEKKRKRE